MKVFKCILLFVAGLLLGVLGAAGVYYLTVGEVAWQAYIEEKLIPNATTILTALCALYVAVLPILARVKHASAAFESATDGVNATAKKDADLVDHARRLQEENEALQKAMCAMRENFREEHEAFMEEFTSIKEALRVGLGNNRELVEKGFAVRIVDVLKSKNKKEEGTKGGELEPGEAETKPEEETGAEE